MRRIAIIGPSNSGKSTLAVNLGRTLGLPAFHLDQIAHVPGTNWQRRPDADFIADHDRLIAREDWVIEGNYGVAMPQRFARAQALIWLDPPLAGCLWRYVRRSLFHAADRPGNLDGAQGQFSFGLIKYTLVNYPRNRIKYREYIAAAPHLRVLTLHELTGVAEVLARLELPPQGQAQAQPFLAQSRANTLN